MTAPDAAALLVDHPAVPVPTWEGGTLGTGATTGRDPARLGTVDRNRAAVQLTAVASLLADLDLWPTSGAIRNALAVGGPHCWQVVLGQHPFRLTTLSRRLGGGEAAAEALRERLLAEVARRCGVEPPGTAGDGYFLEPSLRVLLDRLGGTVDRVTARNLWAIRWVAPPIPEEGEASYWTASTPTVAIRVGAAVWSAVRRRGQPAWLRRVGQDDVTAPLPPVGARGLLVLVGALSADDLAGLVRWTAAPGCSGVAIGTFPAGWAPPVLPFDRDRLDRHLFVAAGSLDLARRVVERRRGRFHPLSRRDREALTDEALRLVAPAAATAPAVDPGDPLRRMLGLIPEGIPEGLVRLHSGLPPAALESRADDLDVVKRDGVWRLPEPAAIVPDPLHEIAAELFDDEDPRRLLHLALSGRDEHGRFREWCNRRVLGLDGGPVRTLLLDVERGCLGSAIEEAMADACLLRLDLSTARLAIAALGDAGDPWRRWLEVEERSRGRGGLVKGPACRRAILAAAVVALDSLRRGGDGGGVDAQLGDLAELGGETVARWIRLERAAIERPERLGDRAWRRGVVGAHPYLIRRLLRLRALALEKRRPSATRRLLGRLAADDLTPGERGLLELDLGSAALARGLSDEADAHGLRAMRLLQAAGFEGRTRIVRFNLAVSDIDRLRVASADRRLTELEAAGPDPFVTAERARWSLAVGDLDRFRGALAQLDGESADSADPRVGEARALLRGVCSLIDGDHAAAIEELSNGGEEGAAWMALTAALHGTGLPEMPDPLEEDGWGLLPAARRLAAGPGPVGPPVPRPGGDLRSAVSAAIIETVAPGRLGLDSDARRLAAATLSKEGLDGWAQRLRRRPDAAAAPLEALGRLLEAGHPSRIDRLDADQLVRWVGVDGLEVRRPGGGAVTWRHGDGAPRTARRAGSVDLVPLGGEPAVGSEWRVLAGALDLLLGSGAPGAEAAECGESDTGIAGRSPAIRQLRERLRVLAPTRIPVLVIGETGSGKELVSRALHRLSGRAGAFVAVNVAAIPDTLLEAELFGSVRGAFSGADRSRRGLAVSADHGTLFLDEIGEMSLPMQVKLLRFLESGEVRPVGGDAAVHVDARIVAATHRDLRKRIARGTFREDLYYRIRVEEVPVPPLRDRETDIPILRALFEEEAIARHGVRPCRWSLEADHELRRHPWPGNVRELRHAVEVAMVRAAGATVTSEHLPFSEARDDAPLRRARRWNEALDGAKREILTTALARHDGNRSAAARELGISRQAVLYHLRQLGIGRGDDRDG